MTAKKKPSTEERKLDLNLATSVIFVQPAVQLAAPYCCLFFQPLAMKICKLFSAAAILACFLGVWDGPGRMNQSEPTNPVPEEIAEQLYATYCHNVGGKAWNGDALPTWDEFRADPKKTVQSDAWVATAVRAIELLQTWGR